MPLEFAHNRAHDYPEDWKSKVRPVLVAKLAAIEARVGSRLLRVANRPDRVESPIGKPGTYGAVYALESFPDRVLKISMDRREGPYSFFISQQQGLGIESASGPVAWASAVVFDVFRIEHDGGFPLWGIVVERLQTFRVEKGDVGRIVPPLVPAWVVAGANRYTEGWDAVLGHPVHLYEDDGHLGRKITRRARKLSGDEARTVLEHGLEILGQSEMSRPVADFLRLMLAVNKPLTDVHEGNLAIRREAVSGYSGTLPGQLVVFDYGSSSMSSAVKRLASKRGSGSHQLLAEASK